MLVVGGHFEIVIFQFSGMMQLEATTWIRDSHELFDYESRSIERAAFNVDSSIRVYRRGVNVVVGRDRDGGMLFQIFMMIFRRVSGDG